MIIMRHDIGIVWPDNKRDIHHVDLVVYGDQDHPGGFSAMAKTVGYPTAIASKMILEGNSYFSAIFWTHYCHPLIIYYDVRDHYL